MPNSDARAAMNCYNIDGSVPVIDSVGKVTVHLFSIKKDRIERKTTNVRELIYGSNFISLHKAFFGSLVISFSRTNAFWQAGSVFRCF